MEIAADDGAVFASWEQFMADGVIDPRLPMLGWRLYGGDVGTTASEDDYQAFRRLKGVPDPAADAVPDKTYPIEANFDLLNGIDFAKGCFVGQETTSRMKRRGVIKNRMVALTFEGPAPAFGAEDLAGRTARRRSADRGAWAAPWRWSGWIGVEGGDLTVDGRPVGIAPPRSWTGCLVTTCDRSPG